MNYELARAWDAGFTACAKQHMKQQQDQTHPITRVNPYLVPNDRDRKTA